MRVCPHMIESARTFQHILPRSPPLRIDEYDKPATNQSAVFIPYTATAKVTSPPLAAVTCCMYYAYSRCHRSITIAVHKMRVNYWLRCVAMDRTIQLVSIGHSRNPPHHCWLCGSATVSQW